MDNIQDNEVASTEKSQVEKDDNEYWLDYNAETLDFQYNQLLYMVSHYSLDHISKQVCQTSFLSGKVYIQELLHIAYPRQCIEVLQMLFATFLVLKEWLVSKTSLKKSHKRVSIIQKLAMFLQIVGERSRNYAIQERFQYFGDIVLRVFHEVLVTLMIFHQKIVLLPLADTPLADQIAKDSKYFLYFENCIGVLDGIHIPVYVPTTQTTPYHN